MAINFQTFAPGARPNLRDNTQIRSDGQGNHTGVERGKLRQLFSAITRTDADRDANRAATHSFITHIRDTMGDAAATFAEQSLGNRLRDGNPISGRKIREIETALAQRPGLADQASADPGSIAPKNEHDRFLAANLVNYRKMNICGTEVGGGARPAGNYLGGRPQQEVLEAIAGSYQTVLSIDHSDESKALGTKLAALGLRHETGAQYHFPDWTSGDNKLFDDIRKFIQSENAEGRKVFIHCGAGNGRTGTVLAALVAGDMMKNQLQNQPSFGLRDLEANPSDFSTKFEADGDVDALVSTQKLPTLSVNAMKAVREAVQGNTGGVGNAIETDQQASAVAMYTRMLVPDTKVVLGEDSWAQLQNIQADLLNTRLNTA